MWLKKLPEVSCKITIPTPCQSCHPLAILLRDPKQYLLSQQIKIDEMQKHAECCKSSFTLTFAIELLDIEVWHDCNEGWLDLGQSIQGLKIQYQLYPGWNYDLNVVIWPHCVKIYCDTNHGWVRTWQFLERRWFTFSIKHLIPIRVMEFRDHKVTVVPTFGLTAVGALAKTEPGLEVYLPPLKFGTRRYFGEVLEQCAMEQINAFLKRLIWESIVQFIPETMSDDVIDMPYPVNDVRHQDAILYTVQNVTVNINSNEDLDPEQIELDKTTKETKTSKTRKESLQLIKDKKRGDQSKSKFELRLSGNAILAGTGRVIPFEPIGDRPAELGEIIVVISSKELPANDDLPIVFVNVDKIYQLPVDELKKARVTGIYTQWKLGGEVHRSELRSVSSRGEVKINDHHALPLHRNTGAEIVASFLDCPFEIELRGVISKSVEVLKPKLFGKDKNDRYYDKKIIGTQPDTETDVAIAVCKVYAHSLAKGINGFVRGEYPLYPLAVAVVDTEREASCTNDINAIRAQIKPRIVIPTHVILESQMTLEVSLGFVGCIPSKMEQSYSRLYCEVNDADDAMSLIREVIEINEALVGENDQRNSLLTGFVLDTGKKAFFFIEGPRDGAILHAWEIIEDFKKQVRPIFSTCARYPTRIYDDLLTAAVPFMMLKMAVPLCSLLACPPVYARPALPLPARSAVLKIGRFMNGKLNTPPSKCDMPTFAELRSFRLELCSPPKTMLSTGNQDQMKLIPNAQQRRSNMKNIAGKTNWDK